MLHVLMSIKPIHADAILKGDKTVEIRRRLPNWPAGTVVYIYSSSPVKAVVGSFTVSDIWTDSPKKLWRIWGKQAGITQPEFMEYLEGNDCGFVIELTNVKKFLAQVPLVSLRSDLRVEPLQSFRYLTDEEAKALERMAQNF